MLEKENQNKLILEIKDEIYFLSSISYIILAIVAILVMELSVSDRPNHIGHMASSVILFRGLFGLLHYFNNPSLIKFHEENIQKTSGLIEINIDDIKEIYRISFIYILDLRYGIKKHNLLSRFILILLTPILAPLFFLNVIFKKIYYRNKGIYDLLVIIGKDDKKKILIQLPLKDKEKQSELENYFIKYLNTDVKNLRTRFFLPNNEPWFIKNNISNQKEINK